MVTQSTLRSLFDLVFALLCAGPLTVTFWRGTFNGVTELVFKDLPSVESRCQPALILYLTGTFIKIIIDLTKHLLRNILINKGTCIQTLATFIILYLDAFFGVVMWVGGFNVLYAFPGLYWVSLTSALFIGGVILVILQAFHCAGGVPMNIATDTFGSIFDPCNYFGTKFETDNSYKLIFDTLFTYGIVHTLVICCWWGLWELENRYILFPCEITIKDIQAWDSVIIAYFLVFVVVGITNLSKEEAMEEDRICSKRITNNFVASLCFIAAVNYWRGIWSLMDFYFFPALGLWENLLLSHIIGFLGSILLGTTLSLTQTSKRDSVHPEFFSCEYFSSNRACGNLNQYEDLDQARETTPLVMQV